jgi:hypothetical protein
VTDLTIIHGARQPTNVVAGTTHNSLAGATAGHLVSFPIGTPVAPSRAADRLVVPADARPSANAFSAIGLAGTPGIVGGHVVVQSQGVLTLTEAQWDVVTGGSGGLARGAPYYLSSLVRGRLTTSQPLSDNFLVRVGIALSATDFLILICCPELLEL